MRRALFLLTGGAGGPVGRMLAEGQLAEARSFVARLREAFPDRMAMELQRHGTALERAVEPGLIMLADEAGLPLVATNECFFAAPEMHLAHDALLCIAEGRLLSESGRRRVTPEHWFKPAADDARAVRRSAGGLRQHAGDRAELRGDGGDPQADAAGLPEGA